MKVFLTGAAGFIGFHVAQALLARGDEVVGYDNVNDYYDPALKEARLKRLDHPNFRFVRGAVEDARALHEAFASAEWDRVIHLAAQPIVRTSYDISPGSTGSISAT